MNPQPDEGDEDDKHAYHAQYRDRPHGSHETYQQHDSQNRQDAVAMELKLRQSFHIAPRSSMLHPRGRKFSTPIKSSSPLDIC